MEFLARAELDNVKPKDVVLQKMLDKNPGKYANDAIYSFDQVYLAAIDPEIAEARAEATLAKLKDGADWTDAWRSAVCAAGHGASRAQRGRAAIWRAICQGAG